MKHWLALTTFTCTCLLTDPAILQYTASMCNSKSWFWRFLEMYSYTIYCKKVELFKTVPLRRYSCVRHIWAYSSTAVWRFTYAVSRAQSFHRANAESSTYTTLDLKGHWVYCYCRGHISSIKSSASGLKTSLAHREEFSPSGFDLIEVEI